MRNGLFISPGVKIREVDQSIVPDIFKTGIENVLIFIQSDWGPEFAYIDRGSRHFAQVFGIPKNIDSVSKISYDQQYRLSRQNCNLWVFRLNYSDNPMHFQHLDINVLGNTFVPITQKYGGSYGNQIHLNAYVTNRGLYVLEVYVEPTPGQEPLLEETFTQRDLDGIIATTNRSSVYVQLSPMDLTPDSWQEMVTMSSVNMINLSGGQNGSPRKSPTDFITEDILANMYEFKFTFLVTQGQLTSPEVNTFLDLAKERKDFVILHEFVPEHDQLIHDDIPDEFGIPNMGWENWSKFVCRHMESFGLHQGFTYRYKTDLSQSYLSVYHPWVIDSTNDFNLIPYPPSVHQIEVFLKTLNAGGEIWEQMAGLNRGELTAEPINILTKIDSDVLYLNNVNPIVKFQGQGTFVWGQKTHYMRNSQLSRLNQRMVAIVVEHGIQSRMKRFLFEPMIQSTFNAIENSITTFMNNIQNRHGIVAYEYELDIRPEFIERNYLPIKIRFIPTKTLEFIEIRFIVKNLTQEM